MLTTLRVLVALCLVACSSGPNPQPATPADPTQARASVPGAGSTPSPSTEPVSCEPYAVCGCEMGCVAVRRVAEGRYRVEQGREAGQVLVREAPNMPLHPDGAETCDESCRPAPATRTCRMTGDACAEVPASP